MVGMVASITFALTMIGGVERQFPPIGGQLPNLDIPGLERLFQQGPPLTTTLKDAGEGLPFLDGFEPAAFIELGDSDRNVKGTFTLRPGYYEMNVQSFCAKGYSSGPWSGLGHVSGPYLGAKADLFPKLLERYNLKPEVDQRDAQLLFWGLLSRAKPKDMRGGAQRAATALLTRDEINQLNGYGIDVLNDAVMRQLLPKFNAALRPIYEFDNRMRRMVYDANRPFEEIERLAVLPRDPSAKVVINEGRWSWHPNGYIIRYYSSGYSRMKVQVVVPHKPEIKRDEKGRIIRLECPPGYGSEVEYDDSIPGWICPQDPSLVAFKFKKIRIFAPGIDGGAIREAIFDSVGWTFVKNRSSSAHTWLRMIYPIAMPSQDPNFFQRWAERFERWRENRERIEEYQRQAERMDRWRRGEYSTDDFLDIGHYRDGIQTATTGTTEDRLNWIGETHTRGAEAVVHATNLLDSLPDGREVNPGDRVVVPGTSGGQLLFGSTRSY